MNKQAYALQKIGETWEESMQGLADRRLQSLGEAKHDFTAGAVTGAGLLGTGAKNIYDTAKKHDGSYVDSVGRLASGTAGAVLGGGAASGLTDLAGLTAAGHGEEGQGYGQGALTGAVLSAGMLGGQHLGQKGYDALVRERKRKEEEMRKRQE